MTFWALIHPAIFWTGVGLVSVPILIHLFFRHRHRRVRWGAMQFLLAAMRKQKRRIRMENLILLLLRCAMILLLALALARPRAGAGPLGALGGADVAVVMVLDTSGSMEASHTGKSAWERARQQARAVLQKLGDGSQVTLILSRDREAGGAPRVRIEKATPDDAARRLAGVRPSPGANDLAEIFRLAGHKLDALQGKRLVVFVTDLQRRDWVEEEPDGGGPDAGAEKEKSEGATNLKRPRAGSLRESVRRAIADLKRPGDPRPPPMILIDVGGDKLGNVVVTELARVQGREPIAGTTCELAAEVRNYGPEEVTGDLVLYRGRDDGTRVRLEARRIRGLRGTIGAGEVSRMREVFFVPLAAETEGPGRYLVRFESADGPADRLEDDSLRYLSLTVRPRIRILAASNVTGAMDVLSDTMGFQPFRFEADHVIRPELITDPNSFDPAQWDLLIWADPEIDTLDLDRARTRLESFVRDGGSLLLYLGTEAKPQRTNRIFWRERAEGLLPAPLAETPPVDLIGHREAEPAFYDLGDAPHPHPMMRGITESEISRKFFFSPDVIFFRHFTEELPKEKVVLNFTYKDSFPAIVEHSLGRGRIVAFTTTPDKRGMRLNSSVLPAMLFLDAVHYLVSRDDRRNNVVMGSTIKLAPSAGAKRVLVERPEAAGGAIEEPLADPKKLFEFHETDNPGFYRFTFRRPGVEAKADAIHLAAVNGDAREGDLRRLAPSQLQGAVQRGVPGLKLRVTREAEVALPEGEAAGEGELSRALLAGVGLLLLLELFLAGSFGRRRRAAP